MARNLPAAFDPIGQRGGLRADRGRGSVAGVHGGVGGKGEQLCANRVDDRVEVGQRPTGEARSAREKGVAGEDVAAGN